MLVAALLVMAVLVNSAFTGILSGPFARYNARIVWLAPVAALLVGCAIGPGFDIRSKWNLAVEWTRKMTSGLVAR